MEYILIHSAIKILPIRFLAFGRLETFFTSLYPLLTPVGFLYGIPPLQGSKLTFSYVNSNVPYGNDAVFFFPLLP